MYGRTTAIWSGAGCMLRQSRTPPASRRGVAGHPLMQQSVASGQNDHLPDVRCCVRTQLTIVGRLMAWTKRQLKQPDGARGRRKHDETSKPSMM
jgi:hypothetical protein